ncbi:MAG: S-layer homology domain-containing protein [Oscillospiraceae bacterium]|nr:S-layer homology domain-containing protein [Oscillospiraceae bacterium]
MWKKGICIVLILCIVLGAGTAALATEYAPPDYEPTVETDAEALTSRPFLDVSRNDWFFTAVHFVSARDIMQGPTNLTFAPGGNFSRAMVVATLFRTHYGRLADGEDSRGTPFHDVSPSEWYAPYVAWAHGNGIVDGVGGGRFAPNDTVTRQQFATMLLRFVRAFTEEGITVQPGPQWENFIDRDEIADWAYEALTWANAQGIVMGRGGSYIAPNGRAIRAEAATMLTRFLGGNADAPPPPLPNVNIADLLGADFLSVWMTFGDLISTPLHFDWEMRRFQSGITIGVDTDGKIGSINVDYRQPDSGRFHYAGLSNLSSPADIRTALGAPTISDGISYVYWLGGEVFYGPVLFFNFDSYTDRVDVISLMHILS